MKKVLLAAIVAVAAIMFAVPAIAQFGYDGMGYGMGYDGMGYGGMGYGMGYDGMGYGNMGYGMGGCASGSCGASAGGNAMVGAPQDCMATISCNVPVTEMVPYMTTQTQMTTVQKPVIVPQQSSVTVPKSVCVPEQVTVTVPKEVIVPEQVPVTTYAQTSVAEQVPVQVPAVAYQPCTTMVPQTKTVALGSAGAAGYAPSAGAGYAPSTGAGYAAAPGYGTAGTAGMTAQNVGTANVAPATAGTGLAY